VRHLVYHASCDDERIWRSQAAARPNMRGFLRNGEIY